MSINRRARVALLLSTLAITLLGNTAAAGSAGTLWVDDDGHAGPTGCGDSTEAAASINGALATAVPGDRIRVCPGTYHELVSVTVPSVTLESVKKWKAVVRADVTTARTRPAGDAGLLFIQADHVTVRWFKLVAPSADPCRGNNGGIFAYRSDDVAIRSNRIIGGSDENSRTCGLATGIELNQSSGMVAFNIIRNYNQSAINVNNGSLVHVFGNSIHWAHVGLTCAVACLTARARPAGFVISPAISVSNSTATIAANHIESDVVASAPAPFGISIGNSTVRVRNNVVLHAQTGIQALLSDVVIVSNRLTGGADTGIWLGGPTASDPEPVMARVRENQVRGYQTGGIYLLGGVGWIIKGNDFTGNPGTDCADQSDPTASVWRGNLGDDANQPGLCTAP